MTPMIDVVFLMIVFFVCIDFRVLESKLAAWLPRDRGSSPDRVDPIEQLSVRVHVAEPGEVVRAGDGERFVLRGHRVRWEVGPTACADFAACRRELERVASDPQSMLSDRTTGGRKLMACVVEGEPGTRYDDVARTADLCHAAGFTDIHFGGGRGAIR
jgi:biopolymer transport protein ExbD